MNVMRKPWSDEYLSQAIDEEIELALLKLRRRGEKPASLHLNVEVFPAPPKMNTFHNRDARTTLAFPFPKWRRDWRDAGQLSTELLLNVRHDPDEGIVSVGFGTGRRNVSELYSEHPDKDAATMAAIVRAAIRLLTEMREQ